MPRKSAAALQFPTIPSMAQRLHPPKELDATERKIFVDLVAASKPEAFRVSDMPLLAAYCRAIALECRSAQALAAGDDKALSKWAQATKVMSALSMRLRLSPQARAPNNPTRPQPQPQHPISYYDRMRLEGDDA
jgi:phage terminase small subunit